MSTRWQHWAQHLLSTGTVRRRKTSRGQSRRNGPSPQRLRLESLERRDLLSGTWTALTNAAPDAGGTMILLPDGTVAMHDDYATPANRNRWYRLIPSATGSYINGTWGNMAFNHLQRLYFASNVLLDGRLFALGGEYSGSGGAQNETNTGEIYSRVTDTWSNIANFPQAQFGDDPTQIFDDGRVLAGYINGPQTYLYNPATNTWSASGTKLYNDPSSEEGWVKLADGSILSYDVQGNTPRAAQRYLPGSGTWVAAGTSPVELGSNGGASIVPELGPGLLLPDGRALYLGASGNTAYYNPSTNSWTAGPVIPNGLGAFDAPAAMLPNGHVLFAASHIDGIHFSGPTKIFEFDPTTNTYADVTPSSSIIDTSGGAFTDRMLVLPTGQVLFNNGGNRLAVWTPIGSPTASWLPAVRTISGTTTTLGLEGTQLNGLSEGAAYGDDAEMSSNYPIVQYRPLTGSNVSYALTANWTTAGVATGSTLELVSFTLPSRGIYLLNAIANGIASPTILNVEMTSTTDNLVIRNNPSNSANVQVVSGSTVIADTAISAINKIIVTCDGNRDTLTVSYQYGNPLPTNGLEYAVDGLGLLDTLNLNDQTSTSAQTFTLGNYLLQRSGSAPITFFGDETAVNVNGGSGNNTYIIDNIDSFYGASVNTGAGADSIFIRSAGGRLTVTTTTDTSNVNTIFVGDARLLRILEPVTINNTFSVDHLDVDDSADAANRVVNINDRSISGLGPASINWTPGSLDTMTIDGGTGNNTYTVNNPAYIAPTTTVNTGSGGDTVNVLADRAILTVATTSSTSNRNTVNIGNAGSLGSISATVNLVNVFSFDHLVVDASAEASNRTVSINPRSISGYFPDSIPINWLNASLDTITILGGMGSNTYTVNTPDAYLGTTLNTGSGGNRVNVQGSSDPLTINTGFGDAVNLTGTSNTLDPIGAVTVNDSTSSSSVTVDDSGYGGDDSYSVTSGTVTVAGLPSFSLSYSGIGALTLNTGSGSDTLSIDSTSVATTVNAGSGGNTFRVSPFTQWLTANIVGPSLTLNGGGGDILELFDANDPNVEGFNFDAVPQSLVLDSTGTDVADFFGMGGGVYVVTNGFSNENDSSGTVIFDPSGGPPNAGGSGPQAASTAWQPVMADVGSQPPMVEAPPKATAGAADGAAGSTLPVQGTAQTLDWAAIDQVLSF